jgi:hypothetical protein
MDEQPYKRPLLAESSSSALKGKTGSQERSIVSQLHSLISRPAT